MHDKKPPTFAFVGWNAFQMLRFRDLARALPGSVLVVEKRPGRRCEISDELLTSLDPPVLVWDSRRMRELDGVFDVVVCQTVFGQIEQFERSKIAMLQYGLAKEPHNHGPWRALADLCLVYGPYTAGKISHLCPVAQVGNPHFDAWHTPAFHETAKRRLARFIEPSKKTILYVPTWGPLSTQDEFIAHVEKLSDEHNVLIKLHHNTAILEHERWPRATNRHVHYFGADDDLLELLVVADLAISDYSGAIFDALYCRKPVVLVQTRSAERFGTKLDQNSIEHSQRHRIGANVCDPSCLSQIVSETFSRPERFSPDTENLVQELYVPGPGSTQRCVTALSELAGEPSRAGSRQPEYRQAVARSHLLAGSGPKYNRERDLLEYLRRRRPRMVLRYIKLRSSIAPRVYLYRAGIRAAVQLGSHEQAMGLLRAAKRTFPQAVLDYELNGNGPLSKPVSRAKLYKLSRQQQANASTRPALAQTLQLAVARSSLLTRVAAASAARAKRHTISYQLLARAQRYAPGDLRLLVRLSHSLRQLDKTVHAQIYDTLSGYASSLEQHRARR